MAGAPRGKIIPFPTRKRKAERTQPDPTLCRIFEAVVSGKVAAVRIAPIESESEAMNPAQHYVVDRLDELIRAGLDYHETAEFWTVFFNPKVVSVAEIEQAERDGSLDQRFPEVTTIE